MRNNITIAAMIAGSILLAGMLVFMSAEKAAAPPGSNPITRDNVMVHHIVLAPGQVMVIVDNAGIGGTSDVEVTWRFDPTKCQLARVDGTPPDIDITPFGNDGALGGNPAHSDQVGVDAIVLTTQAGQTCTIDPTLGQFVTVSTVGSAP